jgi:hypothetical protein
MPRITVRKRTDHDQWVTVELETRSETAGSFVEWCGERSYNIVAVDDSARTYEVQNWESGVVSGSLFFWRRQAIAGVVLSEVRGQLAGDGIDAIAFATSVAIARSLPGYDVHQSELWEVVDS